VLPPARAIPASPTRAESTHASAATPWLAGWETASAQGPNVALSNGDLRKTVVVTSSSWVSAFAGFRIPREVISVAARGTCGSAGPTRDVEDLRAERGVDVDRAVEPAGGHAARSLCREQQRANAKPCESLDAKRHGRVS
jgi:hypothetical protein